ncbi:phage/plasmid primase, P4 family, partial [Clostridium botulinum]
GGGSNGKSTLLEVLNELLGEENIASVSLEELNHRFKTFQLEGKLANIGDDISNKYIEDNSTFKKLVTGEKVNVERKGRDPFDFKNYSKLIFSANELPRINDLSGGLKRRLIFIPFNATFSKKDKDYDPFILDKLTSHEAMEYLLKLALEGLNRVLINHIFTNAKVCDD